MEREELAINPLKSDVGRIKPDIVSPITRPALGAEEIGRTNEVGVIIHTVSSRRKTIPAFVEEGEAAAVFAEARAIYCWQATRATVGRQVIEVERFRSSEVRDHEEKCSHYRTGG